MNATQLMPNLNTYGNMYMLQPILHNIFFCFFFCLFWSYKHLGWRRVCGMRRNTVPCHWVRRRPLQRNYRNAPGLRRHSYWLQRVCTYTHTTQAGEKTQWWNRRNITQTPERYDSYTNSTMSITQQPVLTSRTRMRITCARRSTGLLANTLFSSSVKTSLKNSSKCSCPSTSDMTSTSQGQRKQHRVYFTAFVAIYL